LSGYLAIKDTVIDDSDIDTLMGKLGAQYIGDTKIYGSQYRYFSFAVQSDNTGRELEAAVKTRISKLYDGQDLRVRTGMYAIWQG